VVLFRDLIDQAISQELHIKKELIKISSCRSDAVNCVQNYGYPCKAKRHYFTLKSNVSQTAAGNKWCVHAHSGSFSWLHSSNYVSVCIGQTQWLNTSMVIRARDRKRKCWLLAAMRRPMKAHA